MTDRPHNPPSFGDPQPEATPRSTLQWLLRQMALQRDFVPPHTLDIWKRAAIQGIKKGPDKIQLHMTTLISDRTQLGLVELTMAQGDASVTLQLEATQVQDLVVQLLAAAEAARFDSTMFRFCRDGLKLPDEALAAVVSQARAFRDTEAAAALVWAPEADEPGKEENDG